MRDLIKINEPIIGEEEVRAVTEVLQSGILTDKSGMGPRVIEFERRFAEYTGAKYAVAVSSGTAALHAALLAAGVGPGDEVIIPSFTFSATAEAVMLTGARPVFADIDEETYTITIESVEEALSRKTKAIIPVDLYGLPADIDPILEMAEKRDICVIEDAAQSLGATYKDRRVGAIAHQTCFSFYASKHVTTGEGGMITTNDEYLAEALRMIRTHGESKPYWVERLGHNYRMTEMQAAMGIVQLQRLPKNIERRRENAAILTEKLEKAKKLALPFETGDKAHAWHLYTVRVRGANKGKRNKIVEYLRARRVSAAVYYPTPIHLLPYYKRLAESRRGTLSSAEKASSQVISLPVHPRVTPEDLDYIAKTLKKSLTK
ncbi:DegT/DnrJ/EryC1/StrS family aminotransferase [Candidatus Bathyarchaeota archaeon]|nr:DegT/DnrJ/EryC1/StrS family aminotransferase [Candidatus Bathyarchaeota archaeon]